MYQLYKAQKYIAITPILPLTPPVDTMRDIRDLDLVDALMKYSCQPPQAIGAVNPSLLSRLDPFRQLPDSGVTDIVWSTVPVNGTVPVYLLPAWLAPAAPAFKMTLDDMYARDANAASYNISIMVRRAKAGSVLAYKRPHIDVGSHENNQLSHIVQQYVISSGEGTVFHPVPLKRDEAIEFAENIALPHEDREDDPQYVGMAEFLEKKLGPYARGIRGAPGQIMRANPLLCHNAPAGLITKDRMLVRIDYHAGPTEAEFAQMESGTHPVLQGMPCQRQQACGRQMANIYKPEQRLLSLQARHKRNWGVFAPLTTAWSERYGEMAAIPSVIQRHHLVRQPS